jgi:hypothetical protein
MSVDICLSSPLSFDTFSAQEPQEPQEPSRKVRFIMFSSVLNENNTVGIIKTKEHDGTLNDHKRWFATFVSEFFQKKVSNYDTANALITKLIGCDSTSKFMFLKYSIEQIKIVIEKIEEFKAITEEEKLEKDGELSRKIEIENLQKSFEELKFEIKWLEKVGELSRKIEIENLQKSFEELKFEIKWSNSVYDFHAIKRCTRAVSLIREPSRDMGNMKFQPAQIGNVQRFLKFVEDFEEELFMKDYVIVEDEL